MVSEKITNNIEYTVQGIVESLEAKALWLSSGFDQYAPDFDWSEFPDLLKNSDIIVTARHDERLVGYSRAVTDFALYCGLVDIMVDADYKRQGIGRELAIRTRDAAGEKAWLVALSNSSAADFYKQSGFMKIDEEWSSWILTPPERPGE